LKALSKKILFLTPYPHNEAPSQRFRFEQYIGLLEDHGYQVYVQSFFRAGKWQIFYQKKANSFKKALELIRGFLKRGQAFYLARHFEYVFIHREAAPVGPPIIEWCLRKVLRKKIIYDFDDAIWLTDRKDEPQILSLIKWRTKVPLICRWSYKVSCGNEYLMQFALRFNQRAVLNPTTIDTVNVHNLDKHSKRMSGAGTLTIGWTGSHSTLRYLDFLVPVLQTIQAKYPQTDFLVIADRAPEIPLSRMRFVPWNASTEVADLLGIDIGIMPLDDDDWSRGKCGLKGLQYMALAIPTVMSPVGVNTSIISHGENGLLATSAQEWSDQLSELIEKPALRKKLGDQGRITVEKHFSVESNTQVFLNLFT
jgi:glycosyltransferase involved in cell wall biosynthesis